MSSDRDTTRIVRSWLEEGVTQLPDRILDSVLDQLPATPQRRAWWPAWRFPSMNNAMKYGLAAAVLAVVAVFGYTYFVAPNVGGPGLGDPTPTPTPTPAPTPAPEAYVISIAGSPIVISVTLPADGWVGPPGSGFIEKGPNGADPPDGAGLITFADGEYFVYGDPCRWSTTRPDTPATTVDELVAALTAQASRDASEPVDVTVDGYAGKAITLHVPDDANFAECDDGTFASWGVGRPDDPARFQQGPGQIDKVWILDVDGRLVIIDVAYYDETPQDVVDELDAIVESATFSEQP